ncbi:T9SS type A sorting domain-containing protein [Flavobacterium sp. 3HN19-14]|uniref:T9SS type A sorting domain-containing protein n=1 Tax=Flavobacterium sp. 3HN19-14 TaxID=3448133 RepID=UPI003EE26AB3
MQAGEDLKGNAAGDHFGDSVALSANGNLLAVGASLADAGGFVDSGEVRLFQNSGGTWSQIGNSLSGGGNFDNFGNSISLSSMGNKLTIGAYRIGAGYARVYDFSNLLLHTPDFTASKIVVFPNPVKDRLTVSLSEGLMLEKVNFYTATGQYVKSFNSAVINTTEFPAGIYFVEIITGNSKEIKKVIIE